MLTGEGATDLYNNPRSETNDQDAALRRVSLLRLGVRRWGRKVGLEVGLEARKLPNAGLRCSCTPPKRVISLSIETNDRQQCQCRVG